MPEGSCEKIDLLHPVVVREPGAVSAGSIGGRKPLGRIPPFFRNGWRDAFARLINGISTAS